MRKLADLFWKLLGPEKPPFETISEQSICPACANAGCSIDFDPVAKKVVRTCNTCHCVVTQPPAFPDLFK